MTKFNAGDKVRLRKDWVDNQISKGFLKSEGILFDMVYTVTKYSQQNHVFINGHSYNGERFELVESKSFEFKKTVLWLEASRKAIIEAGGVPELVLEKFPEDLLEHLIRNNIKLVYSR